MTAVAEQPTKKAKKKAQDINLSDATVDELVTETAVPVEDKAEDKPEPKPGDADFDWQPDYPGEKVFTYTHDGVTVGLAAVSEKRQPSIGFLRATRKMPQFEQVLDMVEFIASPTALDLVDKWVPTDLIEMFEEWSEWNKTAAGE